MTDKRLGTCEFLSMDDTGKRPHAESTNCVNWRPLPKPSPSMSPKHIYVDLDEAQSQPSIPTGGESAEPVARVGRNATGANTPFSEQVVECRKCHWQGRLYDFQRHICEPAAPATLTAEQFLHADPDKWTPEDKWWAERSVLRFAEAYAAAQNRALRESLAELRQGIYALSSGMNSPAVKFGNGKTAEMAVVELALQRLAELRKERDELLLRCAEDGHDANVAEARVQALEAGLHEIHRLAMITGALQIRIEASRLLGEEKAQ